MHCSSSSILVTFDSRNIFKIEQAVVRLYLTADTPLAQRYGPSKASLCGLLREYSTFEAADT